jgi:hypothetical protein
MLESIPILLSKTIGFILRNIIVILILTVFAVYIYRMRFTIIQIALNRINKKPMFEGTFLELKKAEPKEQVPEVKNG